MFPISASVQERDRLWVFALSVGLAAFCAICGVALLSGALSPSRATWALVPIPLTLAVWFGHGFLQPNPRFPNADAPDETARVVSPPDYGLLLSAGGWALAALALLIPQSAPNFPPNTASAGDFAASVCGALSVLCLLCGGILSWRNWNENSRNEDALSIRQNMESDSF